MLKQAKTEATMNQTCCSDDLVDELAYYTIPKA